MLNVPQLNCIVVATGQQVSAVGGERYASNRILMSIENIIDTCIINVLF